MDLDFTIVGTQRIRNRDEFRPRAAGYPNHAVSARSAEVIAEPVGEQFLIFGQRRPTNLRLVPQCNPRLNMLSPRRMTCDIRKVARAVRNRDVPSNFVEGLFVANKEEVINPSSIVQVSRKVFYQRCHKYVWTVGPFANRLKIAFDVPAAQRIAIVV